MAVTTTDAMRQALKLAVRNDLRPHGWTGRLPHLRRRAESQISLITFQFSRYGGQFTVEIAECGPGGLTTSRGTVPPDKVTAHDINLDRPRLGSHEFPGGHGDHWFVFGPRTYEAGYDVVRSAEHYQRIADDVMRLIRIQGEPWWQERLHERR